MPDVRDCAISIIFSMPNVLNRIMIATVIIRIHENEQLLDWPFTGLLLEALCIKTSNYLQVKGIDL